MIADALGSDGNASMPEQINRPNPRRKLMMMMMMMMIYPLFFFFFRWRYSPLWALACRKIPLHLSLSITNSVHLLTPNTWRSLSTSSLHLFMIYPLLKFLKLAIILDYFKPNRFRKSCGTYCEVGDGYREPRLMDMTQQKWLLSDLLKELLRITSFPVPHSPWKWNSDPLPKFCTIK